MPLRRAGRPQSRTAGVRSAARDPRTDREEHKEIEGLGAAPCRTALVSRPQGGTAEVQEYWLNEEQALLVAVLSRAPKAQTVRAMLIRVFFAWRRGQLMLSVETRQIIGGIVKAVVHKQLSEIIPALVAAEVAQSQGAFVPGLTSCHLMMTTGAW
jgi:hypothetical protein